MLRPTRGRACLLVLTVILMAVPTAAAGAVQGREVSFRFESSNLLANTGAAGMDVRVVTARGGELRAANGRGSSTAVAFPRYSATDEPRAVISTVDSTGADDLDPGTADFVFGADFRLSDVSEGSATDDGNNVLQRGLTGSAMQYKIQLDNNRPSCRIAGSSGVVFVVGAKVQTRTWYRMRCTRSGSSVTLWVKRFSDGRTWTYSQSGAIGSLVAGTRSTPLTVGGKLNPDGTLIRSGDQFNGRVDNAFLDIAS